MDGGYWPPYIRGFKYHVGICWHQYVRMYLPRYQFQVIFQGIGRQMPMISQYKDAAIISTIGKYFEVMFIRRRTSWRLTSTWCSNRTDAAYQSHLKKGILLNPTDYILPTEICAMINVVIDAKNQSYKLCAVPGDVVGSFTVTNAQNLTYFMRESISVSSFTGLNNTNKEILLFLYCLVKLLNQNQSNW